MKPAVAANPTERVSAKPLSREPSFRSLALRGMANDEILEFLGAVDADGVVAWLDDAARDGLFMLGPAAAQVDWSAERAQVQAELLRMIEARVGDDFEPSELQTAGLRK